MLARLRRARADLATLNALLPDAERIARDDGAEQPGAEHLLLASLDVDDIANAVLRTFAIDAADLRTAIAGQHDEALRAIGIVADDQAISAAIPAAGRPHGLYRSQASLQAAFQRAAACAKRTKQPLNSGHILLAAAESDEGTVARALRHLGIDLPLLRERTGRAVNLPSPDIQAN